MIDAARSPNCAGWEKKSAKFLRDNPKYREILEAVAEVEAQSYDILARATIGENLIKSLDKLVPKNLDRALLSHIEARQLLTSVRAEISAAADSIGSIRT